MYSINYGEFHMYYYRHHLEIMLGDKVLPYNMTVYQAVKQYGQVEQVYFNSFTIVFSVVDWLII